MIDTQSVYDAERAKYAQLWNSVADYRKVSFGEMLVGPFLALSGAKPGAHLVDVGCGVGRASLAFAKLGLLVEMVDLSVDCLDPEVKAVVDDEDASVWLGFSEACLWKDWTHGQTDFHWAFCCDVLEHIPTEFTMLVVDRCLQAAERAFLHINFDPDHFGQTIGQPLHVTVQPFTWWRDRLADLGHLVEARDMMGHGLFILERA